MNPYNADSKCPKCGGLALFVCYHDQACACKDTDGEHLQRACGCGFRWPEACRDSVSDDAKAKACADAFKPIAMMGGTSVVDEAVEDAMVD